MRMSMSFEPGGISWQEQEDRIANIDDDREFILALLENNPNFQYDLFSKRYSCHEDEIGFVESKLIERFANRG